MPQQMSADASFQIWWAVIPILLAIIAAVVIIITLLFCRKLKKRKKVLPISQAEEQDKKKVEDVVAVAEEVTITKAQSFEVLVPTGKKDVCSSHCYCRQIILVHVHTCFIPEFGCAYYLYTN